MSIKHPNIVISEYYHKYRKDILAFAIVFLIGVLTHFYVMSNKFFNYFEMGNILSEMNYSQNDTLGLGRWFLPVASNILSSFSVPAMNGMIVLFCSSVSSILVARMFQIHLTFNKVLFGAVWMTFPGMASVFAFGVNSDALSISILLAVLAAGCLHFKKWGVLLGSVLLGFSIGIYQPYMSVTIAIFFGLLLIRLLKETLEVSSFVRTIFREILILAFGFLLYYIALELSVYSTGIQVSNYHGANEMTSFTLKGIAKGLVYSYGYFLSYLFTTQYTYTIGNVVCNIIGAVSFIVLVFRAGVKYEKLQRAGIIILIGLLPLGLEAAPFLMGDRVGNGVDRYMMFSIILIWGLLLWMIEQELKECLSNNFWSVLPKWLGVGAVIVTFLTGYTICNEAYYRMETMTESTTALLGRIAARIESLPEWQEGKSVYFVNPRELMNDNYEVSIPQFEHMKNLPGTEIWPNYNEKAIVKYLEVYLHFPVKIAEDSIKQALDENSTVKNMPSYPARDSIQVIDGVIVVKISDGEE